RRNLQLRHLPLCGDLAVRVQRPLRLHEGGDRTSLASIRNPDTRTACLFARRAVLLCICGLIPQWSTRRGGRRRAPELNTPLPLRTRLDTHHPPAAEFSTG